MRESSVFGLRMEERERERERVRVSMLSRKIKVNRYVGM